MPERTPEEIREPWLPLPPKSGKGGATKSSINFQAFQKYIELPVGERSLRRVAQELNKHEKLMERWSSNFYWIKRALAWDQHRAAIEAEARERHDREKAEFWERRREEQRETDYQLRQTLMQKTKQMLSMPMIERIVDAQGKTITRPARWAMAAVPGLVRASIDLGREVFPEGHGASNTMREVDEFEVISMPFEAGDPQP
jgi:hypothetical protein